MLWGFDMLVEPQVVELDVPHDRRRPVVPGSAVKRSRSSEVAQVAPVPGCSAVPATSALDTVLDCILDRPLREAVAIADSALRTGRCTLGQLRRAASARRGQPFCGRLWRVLRLVDPSCGSVLESALRVLLHEAGLGPFETQHEFREAGVLLGRVDFAWAEARLAVETDGRRWHDPADRRDSDRRRDNGWARKGWLVLRFSWAEVLHQPDEVVAAVREALLSRRAS